MFGTAREESAEAGRGAQVECLGLTFEDENARRAHFLAELKAALEELHAGLGGAPFAGVDDAVARMAALERWPMGDEARLRALAERMAFADPSKDLLQRWKDEAGFPHGKIDDILDLSDPPWHTACPNPFMQDFIDTYGKPYDETRDEYDNKPFAADVSEGKNDLIYNVHSYHTKVPHKAIMRYIHHYTKPGDIVFDGFCGTGMTGVAAAMSSEFKNKEDNFTFESTVGQRRSILVDLSPIATFISIGLLKQVAPQKFSDAVKKIDGEIRSEHGDFYETRHTGWKVRDRKIVEHRHYQYRESEIGNVEFTLYSDVVHCPECSLETTLYAVSVDEQTDSIRSITTCPNCGAIIPESGWITVLESEYDPVLSQTIRRRHIEPVLINYTVGATRFEKRVDEEDRRILDKASDLLGKFSLPPVKLIRGKETRRNETAGVTHLHHFFTSREHLIVARLLDKIWNCEDVDIRNLLLFSLTATLPYTSRMRRFRAKRKGGGPLSGTLYIGSLITPLNVLKSFRRNALAVLQSLELRSNFQKQYIISTQSSSQMSGISSDSVDYIFTDPPFGSNFDYSELNFFWEGILGVTTNQGPEAVISSSQSKDIGEYRKIMQGVFGEYYRVLKPGRWVTVEFSNTKASVWNAIQLVLEHSGFVIAGVSSLDKKQHSFKAVTTPTAMKQDLVISAYKPNGGLEKKFRLSAGTEEGVWEFVYAHLRHLPVSVTTNNGIEIVAERLPHLLFDRMVAFHLLRNATVPLSAGEFLSGLAHHFPERDGMVFLPEQVAEYDRKRADAKGVAQLDIFVIDEASAIQWLKRQLDRKPQSFQDIHPQFLREIAGGQRKHEKLPELLAMLEQNFLRYDGTGEVPSQIHAYLSTNFKDMRKLPKDHSALRARAQDRWYVPDPNKAADMEKRRARVLLREFEEYRQSPQKRLKLFRIEAMRAGFFKAWRDRDYAAIVSVAEKIPETVLQEDQKLLLWYDQALTRTGADP